MLRSMIIGLAIAALLQLGAHCFAPLSGMALEAKHIDWVKVQTDALAHLVFDSVARTLP